MLSNMVATIHMWLFTFKLLKDEMKFKVQSLNHTSFISSVQKHVPLAIVLGNTNM